MAGGRCKSRYQAGSKVLMGAVCSTNPRGLSIISQNMISSYGEMGAALMTGLTKAMLFVSMTTGVLLNEKKKCHQLIWR